MALYDYKCSKCGHIFEIQQKITEEPLKFCPECKGPIKRLISASGIIFKGSGFHVNDYKSKSQIPNGSTSSPSQPSREKSRDPKSQPPKAEPPKKESKSKEISK